MGYSPFDLYPHFGSILWMILFGAPLLFVAISRRAHGSGKAGWLLVTLFLSWLGFGAYLIWTQQQRLIDQKVVE